MEEEFEHSIFTETKISHDTFKISRHTHYTLIKTFIFIFAKCSENFLTEYFTPNFIDAKMDRKYCANVLAMITGLILISRNEKLFTYFIENFATHFELHSINIRQYDDASGIGIMVGNVAGHTFSNTKIDSDFLEHLNFQFYICDEIIRYIYSTDKGYCVIL